MPKSLKRTKPHGWSSTILGFVAFLLTSFSKIWRWGSYVIPLSHPPSYVRASMVQLRFNKIQHWKKRRKSWVGRKSDKFYNLARVIFTDPTELLTFGFNFCYCKYFKTFIRCEKVKAWFINTNRSITIGFFFQFTLFQACLKRT